MRALSRTLARTLLTVSIAASTALPTMAQEDPDAFWHTRPDLWEEPRATHHPVEEGWIDRIRIEVIEPMDSEEGASDPAPEERVLSPNGAYWFALPGYEPECGEVSGVGSRLCTVTTARVEGHQPDLPILVFAERDHLVRITAVDHDPHFGLRIGWINEKLLFLSVWWGRVMGDELIFDVEAEEVLWREQRLDGVIPWQQFQQLRPESPPH